MTQEELKDYHRKANLEELSEVYFRCEGAPKRRKHFEDVWFAIGFQARTAPFNLERVFRLLGSPDLAQGTPKKGRVGWLMQSVHSKGENDVIVGFDVGSEVIRDFWSNSVTPQCSPARHMIAFEQSENRKWC